MDATIDDELQGREPLSDVEVADVAGNEGRKLLQRFDLAAPTISRARLLTPVGVSHDQH